LAMFANGKGRDILDAIQQEVFGRPFHWGPSLRDMPDWKGVRLRWCRSRKPP
jgi:hypothetical protein